MYHSCLFMFLYWVSAKVLDDEPQFEIQINWIDRALSEEDEVQMTGKKMLLYIL